MARNTIKGITVEIGGDTTELGKALESVNKKSDSVSAELREINRLLKMDPGNTELLAQKQKVLAEAAENSAEKLRILKEAEKQVQEQFEKGDVTEEQLRALQREIFQTEKKMEGYQKAAKETADELEKLGKGSDEAEDGAKKVETGADKADKALDKYADSADKAGSATEGIGKAAVAAGTFLGNLASEILSSVVEGIGNAIESSREYNREMGKLDTAFTTSGHSAEAASKTYKELQGVLGETEQAVEAANHLAKLTDNEKDLEKWTDICTGVYATFGASLPIEGLTEAANETAKVGKLTGSLADALNWAGVNEEQFQASLDACTTEQERQALITETLSGLYGEAAEAYRETNAEVIRANKANEEWAESMAEVGGTIEPLLTDVKLLGASLLQEFVPGVQEVTAAFRGLLNGDDGAAANLGEALSGIFSDLLTKITEILPSVVEMGVSLITTLATSIIEALPQLVATLGSIIVTILQGLTEAIPQIVEAVVAAVPLIVDALIASIPLLIDGAVQFLMAIVDAVPLILPPLIEAIPQIVTSIVGALMDAIPQLLQGAIQLLMAIIQAIPIIIQELIPMVPVIVETIVDGLLDCLPVLVDGAVQLLMGIIEAIPTICKVLIKEAPRIVKSIVTGLLKAIPELVKAGGELLAGLVEGMLNFDILGAVAGIGEAIIDGFKGIFQIHSPSRVMAGLGEMLDEGLAVGIEDNAKKPVKALGDLSEDMLDGVGVLNGLTLERRLVNSFGQAATAAPAEGLSQKLDQILNAILSGQVIMLDGKTLVGSTAGRYDTELGQRRVLAERGAL